MPFDNKKNLYLPPRQDATTAIRKLNIEDGPA